MNHRDTGNHAESLACNFLERHGLQLLHRNFHCRRGEIDLIMKDRDSLIFIEVRYRRHNGYGGAVESITQKKRARIIYCARCYLNRYRVTEHAVRFDVIAIDGASNAMKIEWLKDAFRPEP